MKEVRIVGIGSSFGEDCLGWNAVDAIECSGILAPYPAEWVKTFRCSEPMAGLLPLLEDAGAAILIDAMQSGAPPGSLCRVDTDSLAPHAGQVSSHGMGVCESLALARALDILPRTVVLYGIEMTRPETGDESAFVAIPALLAAIADDLRTLFHGAPSGFCA